MRLYVFLLLLGAALFLQTTLLDFIALAGVKPDLVMLLAVFNGFLLGTREGTFLGFIGGLFEDLFAGSYIGLNALSKMVGGYLAGAAGTGLYKEHPVIATGVAFFATAAGLLASYLLLFLLNVKIPLLFAVFRVILPTASYTGLIALMLYSRFARYVLKNQRSDNIL